MAEGGRSEFVKQGAWALGLVALLVLLPMLIERVRSTSPRDPLEGIAEPAPSAPERAARPDDISVSSLLDELTDLTRLARMPDPPYVAHLASSYDRRSRSPSDAEGWFANDDWVSSQRPNYVRIEQNQGRREYVLMEASGPGALVRLWTATPAGILRIYLDGAARPTLSADFGALLSGQRQFPAALAYEAARGFNSYVPIPYRNGCKVTIDDIVAVDPFRGGPLERVYFQINYRSYAPNVAERVRSFDARELRAAAAAMARASHVFDAPGRPESAAPGERVAPFVQSATDAELNLEQGTGGRIRELRLHVGASSESALRSAQIELSFDDEAPSVVPLGDFFGGGPGLAPYDSLPFSVKADGSFISRWVMPFARRARVRVLGAAVQAEAHVEDAPFDPESLYFHAAWRAADNVRTRPFSDLTLLSASGHGRFVGNAFAIENPGARWWGEGDEKIYVDGEGFPSLFGTGTEDYFGYAWSTPQRFNRALHSQTRAEGAGFTGRFSANRFHVLDSVPFTGSLRFDLELWHWEDLAVNYSSIAYYYARANGTAR